MTGYGMGSIEIDNGKLVVEAKAVNHRFLEIVVRFPEEVAKHSLTADNVARKLLERGRVELTANVESAPDSALTLNQERAKAAFLALRELRDQLCPDQPIPLALLAAVPGLFAVQGGSSATQVRTAVQVATERACRNLIDMRAREGALLAIDLKQRVESVLGHVQSIQKFFPEVVENIRRKIHGRIEKLMAETTASLNQSRLEQEVALLADRADVSEELTRLTSHCGQFIHMISPAENQVGRKMEFLLQEMGREVNTIGSKVPELEVTRIVLELKAELERVREQVQNVL
jgi:uncharacterized protein (TIGR00255 family)